MDKLSKVDRAVSIAIEENEYMCSGESTESDLLHKQLKLVVIDSHVLEGDVTVRYIFCL